MDQKRAESYLGVRIPSREEMDELIRNFLNTYGYSVGTYMMLGRLVLFPVIVDCHITNDLMHFAKIMGCVDEDTQVHPMLFGMVNEAWKKLMDHFDIEMKHEWWRQHDEALNDAQKAASYDPEGS